MRPFLANVCKYIAISVLLLAGCGKQNQVSIGVLFPLTGDAGSYGDRGKNGIELALEEINTKGGVNGRTIRVIYEDSRAEPRTGVAAMSKLVTIDKVPVVIGDIVSSVTLAVAPLAEQDKVVLLSPTASAPAVTNAGEFVFRIWPSDLAEGKAIAQFAYGSNHRKIGVLYIQNDYGIGIKDAFSEAINDLGGRITASLGYKPDEVDFRPYLTKLADGKPDAVYLVSYYKDGGLAVKQAAELGLKMQFFGTTAIEDPKLFEIAGKAADGIIYPLSTGFDPDTSDDTVQTFRTRYKQRYGVDPDWVPAQTYDALRLVAEAMQKAGFEGAQIQKTMTQVKGYRGVTGDISFDENGDVIKPAVIKMIRDGKFVKHEPLSR